MKNIDNIFEIAKAHFANCDGAFFDEVGWYHCDTDGDCIEGYDEDEYDAFWMKHGPTNVKWERYGITKRVYAFEDCIDYVFKIPFHGCQFFDWDNDENMYVPTDEHGYGYHGEEDRADYCYTDIEGVWNVETNWDYCELEAEIYQTAKIYGVEEFFAETTYLGYLNGVPIYASENVPFSWYSHDIEISEESKKTLRDWHTSANTNYFTIDDDMLVVFIEQYGEEATYRLMEFVEHWNLSDFHSGNVGFDKNGKLRIIDYSGYHEFL